MQSGVQHKSNGVPTPEPLSRSELLHFSKYGKLPRRSLLKNHMSKERTYFDSGDFALSAVRRVTDNGTIKTGIMHPHRESISHSFSPIPADSNVRKDANCDNYGRNESREGSPLTQQNSAESLERRSSEEREKMMSRRD
ncbi:hypothetical protein N7495_006366 [Penicillium taxi]|uniref:uncharacterized protein n=1 Tax=Penicillium taxi TaxID=168475 RepID=UPI0025450DE1|nr:uncharacterized protein N7495_006366 [Penicillium taxi]KAJ5894675.1 hypothetical protein N7495_006366 [Penicillium taxi]